MPIPVLRLLTAIACCAFLTVAGCQKKTGTPAAQHSNITAGNGDRKVHVSVDGPAFVHPGQDNIVVTARNHEIVIEKERLLVNKKETAKIPAEAKEFDVTLEGDTLTVRAGIEQVFNGPIPK